jgi:hypothetical protein
VLGKAFQAAPQVQVDKLAELIPTLLERSFGSVLVERCLLDRLKGLGNGNVPERSLGMQQKNRAWSLANEPLGIWLRL